MLDITGKSSSSISNSCSNSSSSSVSSSSSSLRFFSPKHGISGAPADMEPPFPGLEVDLSREDLRETAYEVLVYCCCCCSSSSSAPLSRLGSFRSKVRRPSSDLEALLDIARSLMGISKQRDSGLRKLFSKATEEAEAAKLVPLELLLHFSPSRFTTLNEYGRWRRRQLKVLEAGLLVYPSTIHPDSDVLGPFIKKEITELWDHDKPLNSISTRKEAYQELSSAAYWLAGEECNWASGFPLNVHLYDMLLWSLFSSTGNMSSTMSLGADQALLLVKKTWNLLGIVPSMHHVCFAWVLFSKFVASGDKELLVMLSMEMRKAERLLCLEEPSIQSDLVTSVLQRVQRWSETRLYAYHGYVATDETRDVLHYLVEMSVMANKFLETGAPSSSKVQDYIETSLQLCFSQIFKEFSSHGKLTSGSMANLAHAVSELAASEQKNFSPLFQQWHPCPAELAVSTLHTCYKRELRQFLLTATEPRDILHSLESAATLESKLMTLVPAEQASPTLSFASDATIFGVLQRWLRESFAELSDWVDLQQGGNDCALSGVQYLRFTEDILDALLRLPLRGRPELLHEFVFGVDSTSKRFVSIIFMDYGSKDIAVFSTLSALDRVFKICKQTSEKLWSKEVMKDSSSRKQTTSIIQHLCLRLNTLVNLKTGTQALEVKLEQRYGADDKLSLAKARQCCNEGIRKLCVAAAHKVASFNMLNMGAWRGGHGAEVALEFLRTEIETISHLVAAEELRKELVKQVMERCFDVAEVVELQQGHLYDNNRFLKALMDLFKAGGLEEALVEDAARPLLDFSNEKCKPVSTIPAKVKTSRQILELLGELVSR